MGITAFFFFIGAYTPVDSIQAHNQKKYSTQVKHEYVG
jgi:hypothetical protein